MHIGKWDILPTIDQLQQKWIKHVPSYIRKQIEKFAIPSLSLEEEITLATIMENCRDKILEQIYNKRYFIDNLTEDIRKIHLKSRYILLDGFTAKTMRTKELIRLIKRYINNPSLQLANKIGFDYVYISKIAENESKNSKIKPILSTYYDARDKLIKSNVKKLLPICYQYTGNTPFEDIFQTTIFAMIKLSGKYSSTMGFHFGTFATWWVRHELQKYTRKDYPVEIPFDKYKRRSIINKELKKDEQKFGHKINHPLVPYESMFPRIDPSSDHVISNPGRDFPYQVKKEIRERANYQCEHCGGTYKGQCHHIIPWGEGGTNDAENGILLCFYCHFDWGHLGNWKKYNEEISQTLAVDRYIKGNYAWENLFYEEDEEDIIILNREEY